MDTATLIRRTLAKAGGHAPQRNLASAVAVSERTIRRWCNEGYEPTPEHYRRLLKYLGLPSREVEKLTAARLRSGIGQPAYRKEEPDASR